MLHLHSVHSQPTAVTPSVGAPTGKASLPLNRDAAAFPDPLVYILVLNWEGWNDTIECLESVFRLDYPRCRVVVCDNASSNRSLEHIRAWADGELAWHPQNEHPFWGSSPSSVPKPISYVCYDRIQAERGGDPDDPSPLILVQTGANLGFAGGNNVGIRFVMAQPDAGYIWLLNNDTVVDHRSLRAKVDLARSDPTVGMVGAKLLEYDRPDTIQAIAGGTLIRWQGMTRHLGQGEPDGKQWRRSIEVDYVTGASLLVRIETVQSVGPLDERYFLYSEEVDWCLRAKEKRWRLVYAPDATVWHKEGGSVGAKSLLSDYYGVRSSLLLIEKFYPRLLPVATLYSLYRCLLPKLWRRQPSRLRAVMRAYRDFFFPPDTPIS